MKTTPRFPRLRALVRALTSPRRVWFWTTTLPVLLAPVLLYWVMRPGVKFDRRVTVGAVQALFERFDDAEGQRTAEMCIEWSGGWVWVSSLVPAAGQPALDPDPTRHPFGPLVWCWEPNEKGLGLDARWFGLYAAIYR